MAEMKKHKRKTMLMVVFVVVVTIVTTSTLIADVMYGRQRTTWMQEFNKVRNRTLAILEARTRLFPIRLVTIGHRSKTAPRLSSIRNATVTGSSLLASMKASSASKGSTKPAVMSAKSVVKRKQKDFQTTSAVRRLPPPQARRFDPLAFQPKVDEHLSTVKFIFEESRKMWNGRSLLFSPPGRNRLQDEQYFHLQQGIQTGGLNISRLAAFPLEDRMRAWEWDLYERPPMEDVKRAGNELKSTVTLLNNTKEFKVGDKVTVRIDVFDGFGQAKMTGGDEIRVWLREEGLSAGAGVPVTDLGNGSYTATVPLLWPGTPQIKVSLTYPTEIIRAVFYLRNIVKGLRLNSGAFVSTFVSEATICSPFPFSGVYGQLCNLTSLNYGLSWYCGRPTNPALSCKNWAQIRDLEFPQPLPLAAGEAAWFDQFNGDAKHPLRLLTQSTLTIKVVPAPVQVINLSLPCNKRPVGETWTTKSPSGFILHDQWLPLACTLLPFDPTSINQCLKGSTLLMVGDSNLRHMLEMMAFMGLCKPTKQLIGKRDWHAPQLCINQQYGYKVRWRTHALPFHTNNDHWAPRTNQQAVGMTLDEVPNTGKYFVLIHMYLHFTTHHYSVYVDRIRSMRNAVARLLERNPNVKIAIRGPHVAYKGWNPVLGGDLQGARYMEILKEEFQPLYDKVYLLDFWDMTIAAESKDFHPEAKVTHQMLKTFFGYVCP